MGRRKRGTFNCSSNELQNNVRHLPMLFFTDDVPQLQDLAISKNSRLIAMCGWEMETTKENFELINSLPDEEQENWKPHPNCECADNRYWGRCPQCANMMEVLGKAENIDEIFSVFPTCPNCGKVIFSNQRIKVTSPGRDIDQEEIESQGHIVLVYDPAMDIMTHVECPYFS